MYYQTKRIDYKVNRKRMRRFMGLMGINAIYSKPRTSLAGKGLKIYPYLSRGLDIDRSNYVRATDITYIPMAKAFLYLVTINDWYSGKVLSW
jgi:putative transposase